MDNDLARDEAAAEPDAPSGEDLLPQPLVNRYAVPLSTLMGGALVAQTDHVIIQPVTHYEPTPDGSALDFGDAGDGD